MGFFIFKNLGKQRQNIKMDRAPTSVFVPPLRRKVQHGGGVRKTMCKTNPHKTRHGKTGLRRVTNVRKIIHWILTESGR